ncbi:SRPBCC family protein [Micromonospora sp. WMMD558]|uniref:SRPBCC family protein n=1 Tax=Micromonospora sp. WMMD558 TaxID=3403462 RepID=UPI003BF53CDF
MQLEHHFVVAAPVDRAWEVLQDLERIVPCMPGAALTSHEGDEFTGTVRVKLGPMVMTFAGRGRFVERDDAARRMVIEASGRDTKGAGSASATVAATLRADGDATAVAVLTDLTISGRVAQLGRGMIADVSSRLLDEFTACLAGQLAPTPAPVASAAAPSAAASADPSADVAEAPPAQAAGQPAMPTAHPVAAAGQPAAPAASPVASAGARPAAALDPPGPGAVVPAPRGPVEPIDLLGVTGVRATARRLAPHVVTFLLGGAVGAVLGVWLARQ